MSAYPPSTTTPICNTSFLSMMETGIILACSLAWSTTIQLAVKELYPVYTKGGKRNNDDEAIFMSQLVYTLILTIIVIVILYQLQQFKSTNG